jgi:uncharacterized protein
VRGGVLWKGDMSDFLQAVAPVMSVAHETLGWLEFGDAARHIAVDVKASGFVPDVVVAITRGGLLPAGAIAYALGVKNCGALNVADVRDRPGELVILAPWLTHTPEHSPRLLVVDDVAASGEDLATAVGMLRDSGLSVRSACLYAKLCSVFQPDYVWRRTSARVTFPWSALPQVTAG